MIDLDDGLLAAARPEPSTTGVSDTVRAALRQVAAASARARQLEWLEQGGLECMADPDERGGSVALVARYLIDTSAAARVRHTEVSRRLRPLIEGGVVATTASLDADALHSARGSAEYEQLWADRRAAYEYLPTVDDHWQTALGVQ